MGRFINADDVAYLGIDGTILSFNLFAYCSNNPITGYDPTGTFNWSNVLKAAAVVVAVTAVVAATVATAGAAAVAMGAISSSIAASATAGAVVGGLAAGATELGIQCYTRGTNNIDYTSVGIETFVGSVSGAIDGVTATVASVTGRVACKAGRVVLSGVGSVAHSINNGKGLADTIGSAAISMGTSLALQLGLSGLDYTKGKMTTSTLEQYLMDGALTYGTKQMCSTAGIRALCNGFRNRHHIMETVF